MNQYFKLSQCPKWLSDCTKRSSYSSQILSVFCFSSVCIIIMSLVLLNLTTRYGKRRQVLLKFRIQLLFICVEHVVRVFWWPFTFFIFDMNSLTRHVMSWTNILCFLADFLIQADYLEKWFLPASLHRVVNSRRARTYQSIIISFEILFGLICVSMIILDAYAGERFYHLCLDIMSVQSLITSSIILILICIILSQKCRRYSVISKENAMFTVSTFIFITANVLRFVMTVLIKEDSVNGNVYGFLNYFLPNTLPSLVVLFFAIYQVRTSFTFIQLDKMNKKQESSNTFQFEINVGRRRRKYKLKGEREDMISKQHSSKQHTVTHSK
ncbi:Hypothetical_protein [Hexamita inflata]|uniref:Hypothetical_protein n=1 Tax=Hexamita inflata TaxID=28002 RepID=A0AA86NQB0_9EUKA|nr:Hypothetical protein HINF_LOCUS10988 [Hexamita inflata]